MLHLIVKKTEKNSIKFIKNKWRLFKIKKKNKIITFLIK